MAYETKFYEMYDCDGTICAVVFNGNQVVNVLQGMTTDGAGALTAARKGWPNTKPFDSNLWSGLTKEQVAVKLNRGIDYDCGLIAEVTSTGNYHFHFENMQGGMIDNHGFFQDLDIPDAVAYRICNRWAPEDCKRLCEMAHIGDMYFNAKTDTRKDIVVNKAADMLGVHIEKPVYSAKFYSTNSGLYGVVTSCRRVKYGIGIYIANVTRNLANEPNLTGRKLLKEVRKGLWAYAESFDTTDDMEIQAEILSDDMHLIVECESASKRIPNDLYIDLYVDFDWFSMTFSELEFFKDCSMPEEFALAYSIKKSGTLDSEDCKRLCEMAGKLEKYEECRTALKNVVAEAADKFCIDLDLI